jgi:small subunit ribosomal protein S4
LTIAARWSRPLEPPAGSRPLEPPAGAARWSRPLEPPAGAARWDRHGGEDYLTIDPWRPYRPALPLPGTWTDPITRSAPAVGYATEGLPVQKLNLRKGNAPMTKRAESKYKINRRLGVNLWGRAKSPIAKRDYGPGQHGQRRKKPTDFGTQLMAKQKLKGYYGNIGEKQFRKYYEEAVRRKGDTSEKLVEILERRLDAVIYRLKFAITPFAARQFVSHGHVLVNGKRVNIPSYLVRDNDTIEVKEKSKQLAMVLDSTQSTERDVPEYIEVDHRAMKGRFLRAPKLSDVPYPVQMEPHLVVEFYSR